MIAYTIAIAPVDSIPYQGASVTAGLVDLEGDALNQGPPAKAPTRASLRDLQLWQLLGMTLELGSHSQPLVHTEDSRSFCMAASLGMHMTTGAVLFFFLVAR